MTRSRCMISIKLGLTFLIIWGAGSGIVYLNRSGQISLPFSDLWILWGVVVPSLFLSIVFGHFLGLMVLYLNYLVRVSKGSELARNLSAFFGWAVFEDDESP